MMLISTYYKRYGVIPSHLIFRIKNRVSVNEDRFSGNEIYNFCFYDYNLIQVIEDLELTEFILHNLYKYDNN